MRISEQTATFPSYIINRLAFITVVESVYCAVQTDSLYKADYVSSLKVQSLCLSHYPAVLQANSTVTIGTENTPQARRSCPKGPVAFGAHPKATEGSFMAGKAAGE